jgi:hypothetical protein
MTRSEPRSTSRAAAFVSVAAAAIGLAFSAPVVSAQQQIGRCVDNARGMSFAVYSDGMIVQEQNPMNRGLTARDPSGRMYLRVPSVDPRIQAHFISWRGEFVEIDYRYGSRVLGGCQLPIPQPFVPQPVVMSNWGVQTPQGMMRVPQAIVDPNRQFAPVMYATQGRAQACFQQYYRPSGLDRNGFGNCMVNAMAGQRELAAYNCVRANRDPQTQAFCMVGALGGAREQQYAQALQQCYTQYASDYSRYPLCMASLTQGGDAGKLLACVEQQGRSGNVSVLGTAACYGAGQLNLNTEAQIAVQCAVATGGEPYAFTSCAGGQLTARELDKCLMNGVGGSNGCFGPNNTIIQGLNQTGQIIAGQFGPNSLPVQTWNNGVQALQNGSRAGAQAIQNVGNEVSRASTNVAREVSKVMPRITF